ncbi:MAG: type I-D CRISPR-associated protein Cas7/Csc2 [Thermoplasmatales archaeon]|nr:type I-D CRISPR-associated protein Cas7/Csc2 [Thermoplasmatales archaeon]
MDSQENKSNSWKKLKENLMKEYFFVDKVEKSRKLRPEICLIVLREVVDPVLARSSDPERAELFIVRTKVKDDKGNETEKEIVRARINGEKFTSAERLTGLNICRILDQITKAKEEDKDTWSIISPNYLYNEISGGLQEALNPDTVTYGAAGVEKGETFSIKSRVIEGYTYTLEPYNLLNKEQHNALYETGTMTKVGSEEEGTEGEQGRGLYAHVNIEPPTKMVHFVRIEAPTPEMFLYVLYNILNTTTYFARSTRKGSIRNRILGVIFSKTAIGLSSGELIKEHFSDSSNIKNEYTNAEVIEAIKKYVDAHKNVYWKIMWNEDEDFKVLIDPLIKVALLKDESSKEIMREALVELTTQSKQAYKPPEKESKSKPKSK